MMSCSRRWLAWASSLVFLWCALPAAAQEEPQELPTLQELSSVCAPEVQEGRRAIVEHEGQQGVWVHRAVFGCMFQRYGTLVPFAERVIFLEQQVREREGQHRVDVRRIRLAEEGEERALGVVETAQRRAREAEADRDAWHRSRALWAIVGGVVTIALEVVAVYVITTLRPRD